MCRAGRAPRRARRAALPETAALSRPGGFLLTAVDGALAGPGKSDRFRIKIWERDPETVVYDKPNGSLDSTDLTTPGTAMGGGSIMIHSAKK